MPEQKEDDYARRMRALSRLFIVLGVVSLVAMTSLLLPVGTLQRLIDWKLGLFGLSTAPVPPVAVYLLRLSASLWAGIGLMFLVASKDPSRHLTFATVAVGTLMFAGLVTLLAGLETRMPFVIPVAQALLLWLAAGLIIRLWPTHEED